jgi:phage tail-like protein
MIPESIETYIPRFYKRDTKLLAFINKFDSIIADLKNDTLGLNDLIDPMKIPANLIIELGTLLNAGIKDQDSETERRIKVANAVSSHKRRGSFSLDAKPKIDLICGGDSQIFRSFDKDDWILVGDGLTPSAYYWAAMGSDGIDDDLGISLIGEGLEIEVAGNIYIDVDNSTLSAADQARLELEMEDIVPAYMYVHFGYLNVSGQFIEYFVMG